DRLRVDVDLDAEGVVRAALAGLARLAIHDDDGAVGLFAPDQVLSPPVLVQRRVDEFRASICLAEGHFHSKGQTGLKYEGIRSEMDVISETRKVAAVASGDQTDG